MVTRIERYETENGEFYRTKSEAVKAEKLFKLRKQLDNVITNSFDEIFDLTAETRELLMQTLINNAKELSIALSQIRNCEKFEETMSNETEVKREIKRRRPYTKRIKNDTLNGALLCNIVGLKNDSKVNKG